MKIFSLEIITRIKQSKTFSLTIEGLFKIKSIFEAFNAAQFVWLAVRIEHYFDV